MDRLRDEQGWLITASLAVLALVAIGFTLAHTHAVLVPFVLAIFLASVVSPLVDHQVVHWKFSKGCAVITTLLVVVIVMVVVGLLLFDALQNVLRSADRYSDDISKLGTDLNAQLKEWNIPIEGQEVLDELRRSVPRLATSLVSSLSGLLSKGLLVFIFVGFLLAGRNPHQVRSGVYADIDAQIRRYIGTKLIISGVTGFLVWLCLRLCNLELASVFGLLAFMLNFIPSVGSIIATLLPLPTALAQFSDTPLMILAVIAVPGVIQMTIGNVIEPKLMGGGLKLHPVVILLSLTIWGLLWGPIGMLLAVPMTASIRIVLDQFEITRPASRLLAGILPGSEATTG